MDNRLLLGSVGQSDIDNPVQPVSCGLCVSPEDAERLRKRGGSVIAIPRCATDAERGRRYAEVSLWPAEGR